MLRHFNLVLLDAVRCHTPWIPWCWQVKEEDTQGPSQVVSSKLAVGRIPKNWPQEKNIPPKHPQATNRSHLLPSINFNSVSFSGRAHWCEQKKVWLFLRKQTSMDNYGYPSCPICTSENLEKIQLHWHRWQAGTTVAFEGWSDQTAEGKSPTP